MATKIVCFIKGKSIVFFRDGEDDNEGFFKIHLGECSTNPAIAAWVNELKTKKWANPAVISQFTDAAKAYHGLHEQDGASAQPGAIQEKA